MSGDHYVVGPKRCVKTIHHYLTDEVEAPRDGIEGGPASRVYPNPRVDSPRRAFAWIKKPSRESGWGPMRATIKISVLNKTPRDCTAPQLQTCTVQLVTVSRETCIGTHPTVAMYTRKDKRSALEALFAGGQLTNDGKDWLTCALDPFHDQQHSPAGYPDAAVSQTVVSMYQYQTTVTAPGAADWDCHIYSLPLCKTDTYQIVTRSADWSTLTEPNPVVNAPCGPLNIVSNNAGLALVPVIPASASMAYQSLPGAAVEELASGTSRVIAMGFEVHNTTAEIYKQGAVMTYRMPSAPGQNQCLWRNNGGTSFGTVTGKQLPQPPPTQADAARLKTSRTWAAKDGVYATLFQSSVDNPLSQMSSQATVFTSPADPGLSSTAWMQPLIAGLPATPTTYTPFATKTTPYDITGAFFTGLSPQTSLTVKLRVYVERSPGWNLPDLAPLATPSAGYDVRALELYAQAINMLPAAVKVDENAAGDWWRTVLGVVKHVAAPLGSALAGVVPGAGLIGPAMGALAGQLDQKRSISKQVLERLPQAKQANRKRKPAKIPSQAPKTPS